MNETENKTKIRKAWQKCEPYHNLILDGNIQEKDKALILEDLLKMLQILHDYAPKPCFEMTTVGDTVLLMYYSNGNAFNTPQIWKYESLVSFIVFD